MFNDNKIRNVNIDAIKTAEEEDVVSINTVTSAIDNDLNDVLSTDENENEIEKPIFETDVENIKTKYKLLNKFQKFKKRGYDIQNLKIDDDINLFNAVNENLNKVCKNEGTVKTLKHCLWIFTWLFELFVGKLGYKTRFAGFSNDIWTKMDSYTEILENMIKDKYVIDEKTGNVVRIENTSILAKAPNSPPVNLALMWIRDAIQYSAANNASMFTNYNKYNDEEEMLDEPIETPYSSDDED